MMYPSPENLRKAPQWENYLVAQVVQASLGLIPANALAVGVQADGTRVRLVVQLRDASTSESDDIGDIRTTLEDLVGPDVSVDVDTQHVRERVISPHDGIRWVYLRRLED